jgi:protein SCO1/2
MPNRNFAFLLIVAMTLASPVAAHHPGADLDKVIGSRERYFQVIDKPAPTFELESTTGRALTLSDYADRVVILHFVYAHCPDICPLHTAKLAEIQAMINGTPMKIRVQFIGITTDPMKDTPKVLEIYGTNHGLDPANAVFLTTRAGQGEDTTRLLAEAFGHKFVKTDDGYQTHSTITHIIDRNGRWAANFHGLKFDPLNMVLYVNGLLNNAQTPARKKEPGWRDEIKSMFD